MAGYDDANQANERAAQERLSESVWVATRDTAVRLTGEILGDRSLELDLRIEYIRTLSDLLRVARPD